MRFIYIVDDDRVSRHFVRSAANRDTDTLVRTFESGDEFLSEADDLDSGVVLLDLNMPGLDGTEVLERLSARGDGKFVAILVTGGASVASAVVAMKYGAADVIEKPCDQGALNDALVIAFGRLESSLAASAMAQQAKQKIDSLSPRERDVMAHLFDGYPNKATANDLGISPRTVEVHRASAMRKLGVTHPAEAVRMAIISGWEAKRSSRPGWSQVRPQASDSAIIG